jgi:glycerate kinase
MTAAQVCKSWECGIKKSFPEAIILYQPLADGGEGSLEIVQQHYQLSPITVAVRNPLGNYIKASFLMKDLVAYIEMAAASGLTLIEKSERNPLITNTYGTGELIQAAIEHGAIEIYLLLGGSATQDAGFGMAEALGYSFLDKEGVSISPIPQQFLQINTIDDSNVDEKIKQVKFHIVTDVDNVLCGENGSTYTYAVQKGAKEEDLPFLESGMKHIAMLFDQYSGMDIESKIGSGAAGGMGAGAMVFMNGTVESGFEFLSKLIGLETLVQECEVVFTGEGRADRSTLQGKVVGRVAQLAHRYQKKLVLITGAILNQEEVIWELKPDYFATIDSLQPNKEKAIEQANVYLEQLAENAIRAVLLK